MIAKRERQPLPRHTEPSATERALLARDEREWTRLLAPYVHRRPDGGPACTFHRGPVAHACVEPEVFIGDAVTPRAAIASGARPRVANPINSDARSLPRDSCW